MECIEHSLNGNPDFGRRASVTITRNGDLISKMYLYVRLDTVAPSTDSKFAWVRRVGHALIKSVEVEIGGSKIDKQYGTWLNIWYELARHAGDGERGFLKMIGDVPELTTYNGDVKREYILYIPLKFWFNRHVGLALPLIALQYHEVRLHFEFSNAEDVIVANKHFKSHDMKCVRMKDALILVDYIYLDSEERRRFAQVGHEYLIEQLQFTGEESVQTTTGKYKLDFNHPTKELVWAMKNGNYSTGKAFPCYSNLDDWTLAIDDCACKILRESIALLEGDVLEDDGYGNDLIVVNGESCPDGGNWQRFEAGACRATENGKVTVVNNSASKTLWVNTDSLKVNAYSLTDKIHGHIVVDEECLISISNVSSELTVRDLSIPVELMTDCRYLPEVDDVCINQCHNFGTLVDGTGVPFEYALLQLNGHDRFDRREGAYFNYVQPDQHHTNTPADGINVYAFAIHPEQHQPSGTANLSRIDNTQLNIWFADPTAGPGLPSLNFFNADNKLYIFAFSYNVNKQTPRIVSGALKSRIIFVSKFFIKLYSQNSASFYNEIIFHLKATFSNCGKLLGLFVLNHKIIIMMNVKSKKLGSSAAKFILKFRMNAVQRLNVNGLFTYSISNNLRYSLVPYGIHRGISIENHVNFSRH
jgi:hypothetical protein